MCRSWPPVREVVQLKRKKGISGAGEHKIDKRLNSAFRSLTRSIYSYERNLFDMAQNTRSTFAFKKIQKVRACTNEM